ncbi:hypothetical protein ACLPJK_26720 [Pseudomonas aeruginosa]|uniref:hypothetical protein n=1 Tax=Pseudomonas aeruginosa TaxID=287 RepID=UPI003D271C3D
MNKNETQMSQRAGEDWLARIQKTIQKHGHAVITTADEDYIWAYSAGLAYQGYPELVVVEEKTSTMASHRFLAKLINLGYEKLRELNAASAKGVLQIPPQVELADGYTLSLTSLEVNAVIGRWTPILGRMFVGMPIYIVQLRRTGQDGNCVGHALQPELRPVGVTLN